MTNGEQPCIANRSLPYYFQRYKHSATTVRISYSRTHSWDHSKHHTAAMCNPTQCESHNNCMTGAIRLQDRTNVFKKENGHLFNGVSPSQKKKVTFVAGGSGLAHQQLKNACFFFFLKMYCITDINAVMPQIFLLCTKCKF